MADCYPPEADDLHRRWLPREIFADIGLADPDPVPVVATVAKPEVVVAVEELAGIIGVSTETNNKGNSAQKRVPPPPPPPPPAAIVAAPRHLAPVRGLDGAVVTTNGGGNTVSGSMAVAWKVMPNSPAQWQIHHNLVNAGGTPNHSRLPPATPSLKPPLTCGGTGVFLPRTSLYRHPPPPPPAKDGKAKNPRAARPVQQKDGAGKWQHRQKR